MKKYLFISITIISITFFYFFTKEKTIKNEIVLGQSTALSGPAGKLGQKMRQGANSYFLYINKKGGIHGRTIRLESLNDYYEPKYTIKNTLKFIEKDFFAIFGNLGTDSSKAALNISRKYNIPFLVPFTGAEFLRNKNEKTVINLRNSYNAETQALVKFLVNKYNYKKIAVFYQNDSYGKAGYDGVKLAMDKEKLKIVAEGRYRRNTLSYRNALYNIKLAKPEAIIIISANSKTVASFIKSARKEGLTETKFCNISPVGSQELISALNKETKNLIISQVVPLPWENTNNIIKEYQNIYSMYYPNQTFDFVSLEGFLGAKLVVEALKKTGRDLTRTKFLESFTKLKEDSLNGLKFSLTSNDNQALEDIYITDYHNNKFRLLQKVNVK